MSSRNRILFRGLLIAALGPAVCGSAAGEEAGALQPYNAEISDSSISGISSGAYMAAQFGTAWSSVIKGVGIVAGGPYYCAQAAAADVWNAFTLPVVIATGPCMTGPAPDLHFFTAEADAKAASGEIDPTGNLSRQKIYIFHGFNDSVVAERVTDATADFYRHYSGEQAQGNLFYQETVGAGHSQVLASDAKTLGLNSCAANESPFINACKYDQAGIILQHIYGALNPPHSDKLSGTIKTFAQSKYTGSDPPSALSLGDEGYVFVPGECEKDQGARCRVHIALHGCKQDAGDIGRLYVDDAGYNAWADANRIIVLYPQTSAQALNPQACWDWWSYIAHDDSYVTKSGRQIQALKAMLDALTAGRKPEPSPAAAQGAAPARLLVIDVSDTAAALAWTAVEGIDVYRVFRAGADGAFAPVATASGASFADSGLPASSAWRWRVSAVSGGVEGPASPEAAASTLPRPAACGSPGQCPLGKASN